jgi:putative ABC transport system permease protein
MKPTDSIKMALSTLTANKLRSSLTMLGIIIGNASTIVMVGIGQGTQKLAEDQFKALGPNVLFIAPGGPNSHDRGTGLLPRTLVYADAVAIAKQVPSVLGVAPQLQSSQTITFESKHSSSQIIGTTPSFLKVRSFQIATGRFFTEADEKAGNSVVVLGSDLAKKLFADKETIGATIRIKNVSFKVIGLTVPKGSAFGRSQDDVAYIPLNVMSSRLIGRSSPFGQEVSTIAVSAQDSKSVNAAEFQVANLLRRRHQIVNDDDFTVENQKSILKIVGNITGGLTILLGSIASISLFVGGIGVMNIMLASVTERTQEIGLHKAIGATERDITIQFLIESIVLSATGGAIGTAIGTIVILGVGLVTPLPAVVSPIAIITAVTVSGSIGLFFGVVPARRAARLDPIVALHSI